MKSQKSQLTTTERELVQAANLKKETGKAAVDKVSAEIERRREFRSKLDSTPAIKGSEDAENPEAVWQEWQAAHTRSLQRELNASELVKLDRALHEARQNWDYDCRELSKGLAPVVERLAQERQEARRVKLTEVFPTDVQEAIEFRLESHPQTQAERAFIVQVQRGLLPEQLQALTNALLKEGNPFVES